MTTPTREQVVQWAKESTYASITDYFNMNVDELIAFATLARADLEAAIAEKDVEIAQARNTAGYWKAEHIAGNQLIAEQQAHIEVLREALEFLNARIVTMDLGGVVEKALAIQSSTDALREHDAKLVERIAADCELSTKLYLRAIANKIRKGEF